MVFAFFIQKEKGQGVTLSLFSLGGGESGKERKRLRQEIVIDRGE